MALVAVPLLLQTFSSPEGLGSNSQLMIHFSLSYQENLFGSFLLCRILLRFKHAFVVLHFPREWAYGLTLVFSLFVPRILWIFSTFLI